jgi:hypothetical protein
MGHTLAPSSSPECKTQHMNREPEISVVVNDEFEIYWSLSLHNDVVQISLIMVMLRKIL